eukprot:gene3160-3438_t
MGSPRHAEQAEEVPLKHDSTQQAKLKVKAQLNDTVARTAVRCGLLILTWYFLSTALGIFNKKLVGKEHGIFGRGAFPAPMLLTGVQFAFQHVLARSVFARSVFCTGLPVFVSAVLPNGVVTGLDIGFSNTSLVYITMSFYTMCKSTTPIFLLAFAFLWRLESPSWALAGVVAVIVSGLVLLVQGETKFNMTGFLLVMSASCMSGLRFTLTQVLLHGKHGTSDHGGRGEGQQVKAAGVGWVGAGPAPFGGPLEVLEVLTPVMSVTMLLLSLVSEQLWLTLPASYYFNSMEHTLITIALIFAGAIIAFLMVWTEYQVIKETSALTFMIAGTVKEVVTVIASILVFHDDFGIINGIGLLVVIIGVLLFNYYKLYKLKQALKQQVTSRDDSSSDAGSGSFTRTVEMVDGVPIHLVALSSTSSPLAAASAAGLADSFSGQQRRRSSGKGADDEEMAEDLKTLEFEPLLPGNGVMLRR